MKLMTRFNTAVLFRITLLAALCGMATSVVGEDAVKFDVNDISFLWPVPNSQDDVTQLLSADEMTSDGLSQVFPTDAFQAIMNAASTTTVKNSAGSTNNVDFRPFEAELKRISSWKVVSFRVDPSAPGDNDEQINVFGSSPQLRLILQPVTNDGTGNVKIHDFAVHLVFSFLKGIDAPAFQGGPPRFIPDKDAFQGVVNDLKKLKSDAGLDTKGPLTVHPGLSAKVPGFADKVKAFIRKYVTSSRLQGVAFMGIQNPEPWIFICLAKDNTGKFAALLLPTVSNQSAQMLIKRGGKKVMPVPTTTNVDSKNGLGVSTAQLFEGANLNAAVFNGPPQVLFKDIPDIIANPSMAHFFNTDCVSCHTESSKRNDLQTDGGFKFVPAPGISGVDPTKLPKTDWNVHNFGWFPPAAPTITMRTANEAAASVNFINRKYLTIPPVP